MQEVVKMRAHNRRHRKQEWDDAQLIQAAVAGDSEAADILFARYDGYAWKVAIHYTHSHHAAEEAVAAGRASAFEKLSQLRDPSRFGPWLAALVKNSAFTEHRRSSRMVPSADLPDMAFLEDDGEAESTDAERFNRARKALLSLPERHRQAIDMAVFNELPVKEVAASLMIDVNTAYQLLFRARKNLRRAYISTRPHAGATAACRACAAKTLDYLRGNVEVREEVDAHVATCVGCRTLLAEALDDAREMQPLFGLAPVGLVVAWRELARRHPRLIRRPRIRHAAAGSPVTASVCAVAAVALVAGVTAYAVSGHNAPTSFVNAGASGPIPASVSAHGHNGGSGGGGSGGGSGQPSGQGPSSSSTPTTTGPFDPRAHPLVTVPGATTTTTAPPAGSSTAGSSSGFPASESSGSGFSGSGFSGSGFPGSGFPASEFPATASGNPTTATNGVNTTTSPATVAPTPTTTSPTTAPATTPPTVASPPAQPWTTTPTVDVGSHHASSPAPTATAPTTTTPTTTVPHPATTTTPIAVAPTTTTTTVPPTTTTTVPPTTTTTTTLPPPPPPPPPPSGVYLTGNGTIDDSGTVGANATATGTVPASLYGPDSATGKQAFVFDGSNGLSADIPSLLANNFTVSFDLNTSQAIPAGGGIDLLGQRNECFLSNFFDVRLESQEHAPDGPDGHLFVELDQPADSGGATDLATSFPLNDGQWHRIQITRVGQTVELFVDGVLADTESLPSASTSIGVPIGDPGYVPWEVGAGDPCVGRDGTTNLVGEIANIFVGPTSSAPAAKLP